jgi:hypothetical protein
MVLLRGGYGSKGPSPLVAYFLLTTAGQSCTLGHISMQLPLQGLPLRREASEPCWWAPRTGLSLPSLS